MYLKVLNLKKLISLKSCCRLVHHNHKKYKLSYVSSVSQTPLLDHTTSQRIDYAAEKFENKESFVFCETNDRWSFKTLKEKSEDLATGLLALGLEKGDRVALWAPNCQEWVLAHYATAIAGLILVNINPSYKSSELEYVLKKVNCKSIILSDSFKSQNYVDILLDVCPEISSSNGNFVSKRLPDLKSAILIHKKDHNKGFYSFDQVANGGESVHARKLEDIKKKCQFSDPINIQFTSVGYFFLIIYS